MEEKACEKCYENLTGGERTNNQDSRTNLLNDCQNSNETIDTTNDKSEITVLANNLDKALTVNHNDKNLPNGLSYDSVENNEIEYVSYRSELQMPDIMRLIQKDLSEPYSIYTYRYFIHNWPKLCFLVSTYYKYCIKFIF